MGSSGILDKVTIIIPSYYLHHYLKRTLDYYKNSNVKIIVVDSTDMVFKDKDKYDIEYYHLAGMTYSKKLYFASQKVTTDYIFLCSHDDFELTKSLENNIKFLDENIDYVSSQGATLFYNMKYNSFNTLAYIDHSNTININDEHSYIRLEQQFDKNFTHQVYSLVRKDIFEETFKYCSKYDVKDIAISELIQAGIYSISGKFNIFSSMYYIQENLDSSAGSKYPTYLKTNANQKDHKSLRLILSDYLYKNSDFTLEQSKIYIDSILDNFLDNFKDSFFMKIKRMIRKQIPKILFKNRDLKRAKKMERIIYDNLSQEDKKEFINIKRFIENYTI